MSRRSQLLVGLGLCTALVGGLGPGAAAQAPSERPLAPATTAVAFYPGAAGIGDPYVPREGNGGYRVNRYTVDLTFNPENDRLRSTAVIHARATQNLSRFHFDLYSLTVTSVSVDGRPAKFHRQPRELVVHPAKGIRQGTRFVVKVAYHGKPKILNDPDLGKSGWFNTNDGATVVGEPEAGMFWFPVNEHPSDKARIRVRATVPVGLTAVSNGLPATQPTTSNGWTTFDWRSQHPMASYLATLSIGKFRTQASTTASGVRVLNYIDPSFPRSVDRSLARAKEIVTYFERRFGRYPFEAAGGIADNYTSWYALENQTRPTYDRGTVRYGGLTRTVAHELAHQWYGDSVALHRWRDIWLNEGFATYAEWMWRAHDGGPSLAQRFDKKFARPSTSPFWSLVVADPGYAHLFDSPVYDRGALALHALRLDVGRAVFIDTMRAWARNHRDGNGTTADFEALAEKKAGRSLSALFDAWLRTPIKPTDPRI